LGAGGDASDSDEDDNREISLPVMASIDAGTRTPSRLQPRQAARVQRGAPLPTLVAAVTPWPRGPARVRTGPPMPPLADGVLPLRWTDGGESRVTVLRGVRSGAYVRRTGDDGQPGDVAVRAGAIIRPAPVGPRAAVC